MTETITWHPVQVMPDTDTSVLMYMPSSPHELVWPGWYDSLDAVWRCATSGSPMRDKVTHWADMPEGPA